MDTDRLHALTTPQRDAILELGSRGAGGQFDQMALSELFALGLIEVRMADRRLALTKQGRAVFALLLKSSGDNTDAPSESN